MSFSKTAQPMVTIVPRNDRELSREEDDRDFRRAQ